MHKRIILQYLSNFDITLRIASFIWTMDANMHPYYFGLKAVSCTLIITTAMGIELLPSDIRGNYEIYEWKHACAILHSDYPDEWTDITELMRSFRLLKSQIAIQGGRKSLVSGTIDGFLYQRGWREKGFETSVKVDQITKDSPTHKIDCYKNEIAIEIEWNNKDPFFDRDLNNFRLLFDLRVISVGIIITRCDHLQDIFDKLGRGKSYGASTTHIGKLLPRIIGGGGGGCPLLVFGISKNLYHEDC